MKRPALYSSTRRNTSVSDPGTAVPASAPAATGVVPADVTRRTRLLAWLGRHERAALFIGGLLVAGALALTAWAWQRPARDITQEDIDAAVLHTFENKTLPSRSAKVAESVRQAVVRVQGYDDDEDVTKSGKDKKDAKPGKESRAPEAPAKDLWKPKPPAAPGNPAVPIFPRDPKAKLPDDHKDAKPGAREPRVGSGVVIVDQGIILTNLHVVAGAKRLTVTFHDGLESEAVLVGAHPENDLAVIKAKTLPDDLPAATLGAAGRLRPGDEVVAVGFPFGIGPSVSAGVVSGLNREFRSPEGKRILTKLIQFDAAANPGNSGGPLLNMSGEVVGIVTAILNPTEARTFIGIGFATTIEAAGGAVGIPPF
jgi:S1-C subfamily serine protease